MEDAVSDRKNDSCARDLRSRAGRKDIVRRNILCLRATIVLAKVFRIVTITLTHGLGGFGFVEALCEGRDFRMLLETNC